MLPSASVCSWLLSLLLCGAATGVHAATPCSLAATGPATVTRGVERIDVPSEQANCEGLRVRGGPLVACVQDHRNRLSCRTLQGDITIEASHLPTPGSGRSWFATIRHLLGGSSDSATGAVSRRGTIDGLPEGPVALVGPLPPVSLTQGALEGVNRIEFRDEATRDIVWTVTRANPAPPPNDTFKPGRRYLWTLRGPNAKLDEATRRFQVLPAGELAEVNAEVQQLTAGSALTDPAVALPVAAALQVRGLLFDARAVLARAGFAVIQAQ